MWTTVILQSRGIFPVILRYGNTTMSLFMFEGEMRILMASGTAEMEQLHASCIPHVSWGVLLNHQSMQKCMWRRSQEDIVSRPRPYSDYSNPKSAFICSVA